MTWLAHLAAYVFAGLGWSVVLIALAAALALYVFCRVLPAWLAPAVIALLGIAFAGSNVGKNAQLASARAELLQLQAAQQQERAAAATAAVQEAAANAEETQRRLARQKENDDAQAEQLARAAADAATARTATGVLQRQLAALRAAVRRAPADPAPGSSGTPAADALDVLADVFSRADARAGELAEALDRSHSAGLRCERDYDALTGAVQTSARAPRGGT